MLFFRCRERTISNRRRQRFVVISIICLMIIILVLLVQQSEVTITTALSNDDNHYSISRTTKFHDDSLKQFFFTQWFVATAFRFPYNNNNNNNFPSRIGRTIDFTNTLIITTTTTTTNHYDKKKSLLLLSSLSATPLSTSSESTVTTTTTTTNEHTKRPTKKQQTIAVIGSGAVGCYYGSRLWEAGRYNKNNNSTNSYDGKNDVRFYMRNPNDYTVARTYGLNVTSDVGTNIFIPSNQMKVYNTIHDMGGPIFDWIIVSIKSTSIQSVPELIVPLLKHDNTTRLLIIMNGFVENDIINSIKQYVGEKEEDNDDSSTDQIHQQSPRLQCCQTVYGGMALICSNRIGPAQIHHSYFGQLTVGVACTNTIATTTTSSSSNSNDNDYHDEDKIAIERLFGKYKESGDAYVDDDNDNDNNNVHVDIVYEPYLIRGRWKKMLWNLPFNGISVAMGGITVDQIVQDTYGLRMLAYKIMNETMMIANVHIQSLYYCNNATTTTINDIKTQEEEEQQQQQQQQQPKLLEYTTDCVPMMQLSDDMGIYKTSTMLDLVNRRSMEVEYIFTKPLQIARYYNLSTPYLDTIVTMIQAYQRLYNLY